MLLIQYSITIHRSWCSMLMRWSMIGANFVPWIQDLSRMFSFECLGHFCPSCVCTNQIVTEWNLSLALHFTYSGWIRRFTWDCRKFLNSIRMTENTKQKEIPHLARSLLFGNVYKRFRKKLLRIFYLKCLTIYKLL